MLRPLDPPHLPFDAPGHRRGAGSFAAVVALLLIGCGMALKGTAWDVQWIQEANQMGQPAAMLWSMITVFGLGQSIFIVFTAVAHGQGPVSRYALASLLWCYPLGGLITQGLKRLFDVARPAAVLAPEQLQIIGERLVHGSMPSGHSITAGAAVTIALACWRLRLVTRLGLVLLALLIGVSRNTVAAHWPSDVCAGLGTGVLVALVSLWLGHLPGLRGWFARPWAQRLLGVGQVAAGVSMAFVHTGYPLAVPLQYGLAVLGVASGLWRLRCSLKAPALTMDRAVS